MTTAETSPTSSTPGTPRERALAALRQQAIELPSWAFGNSGTRFKVFGTPGTPRDPFEKVSDAAQVHQYTGVAPRVSLHIPWDLVDDYGKLAAHAADLGVSIGMVNANLFQDDDYKLGSLTHADPRVRAKAVAHHAECVEVMRATGSKELKLWLPDGTNYPGQDDLRERQDRLAESLQQVYALLDEDMRLVLEYKFFEPAFYSTDVPDWGTSLLHCLALGERAKVVLDTGHHAPGRTSSSSSCSSCAPAGWGPSTSTPGSTPTTTSWPGPRTRSSCSGSCTRSSVRGPWRQGLRPTPAGTRPGRASTSCSTSATTSRTRSPARSAR